MNGTFLHFNDSETGSHNIPANDPHITALLDSHNWSVGPGYTHLLCKDCGAAIIVSGNEIYFHSNGNPPETRPAMANHWVSAEYPIDCKSNSIKQVIT